MLEAEAAEYNSSRPSPRPMTKFCPRGQLVLEDLTSLLYKQPPAKYRRDIATELIKGWDQWWESQYRVRPIGFRVVRAPLRRCYAHRSHWNRSAPATLAQTHKHRLKQFFVEPNSVVFFTVHLLCMKRDLSRDCSTTKNANSKFAMYFSVDFSIADISIASLLTSILI